MKRYYELSNDELAKLTDVQISKLIDYECALEGIPLLPERPIKPEVTTFEPDIEAYIVKGMYFLKHEEAMKVLSVILESEKYSYNWSGNHKRLIKLPDYEQAKLATEKFFSIEMFASIQEEKANCDRKLKQYEDDKKEYDEVYKLRTDIIKNVMNAVEDAQYAARKKVKYEAEYMKYLILAENDKNIALNFLKNAHSDVDEIEGFTDYLLGLE